jgi:hypothetical protein
MNHWIFQGNPDSFNLDRYIEQQDDIMWSIRQGHLADDIKIGDQVFIWRAAGSQKKVSGVIAVAEVTGEAAIQRDAPAPVALWTRPEDAAPALRVRLHITGRHLGANQTVRSERIAEDPILSDLRILRMRSQTNYRIQAQEAQRLAMLCKNTVGRNEKLAPQKSTHRTAKAAGGPRRSGAGTMIPAKANIIDIDELVRIFRDPPEKIRPTEDNLKKLKKKQIRTGIYAIYATRELMSDSMIPLPAGQRNKWLLKDMILLYIGQCCEREAHGGMGGRLEFETAKHGYVRRDAKTKGGPQGPAAKGLGVLLSDRLDLSLYRKGGRWYFNRLEGLSEWFETYTWVQWCPVDVSHERDKKERKKYVKGIETALITQLCPILNRDSSTDFNKNFNKEIDGQFSRMVEEAT